MLQSNLPSLSAMQYATSFVHIPKLICVNAVGFPTLAVMPGSSTIESNRFALMSSAKSRSRAGFAEAAHLGTLEGADASFREQSHHGPH